MSGAGAFCGAVARARYASNVDDVGNAEAAADAAAPAAAALAAADVHDTLVAVGALAAAAARGAIVAVAAAILARAAAGSKARCGSSTDRSCVVLCGVLLPPRSEVLPAVVVPNPSNDVLRRPAPARQAVEPRRLNSVLLLLPYAEEVEGKEEEGKEEEDLVVVGPGNRSCSEFDGGYLWQWWWIASMFAWLSGWRWLFSVA